MKPLLILIIILVGVSIILIIRNTKERFESCCGASWDWILGICKHDTCDSRMGDYCIGDCCSSDQACLDAQRPAVVCGGKACKYQSDICVKNCCSSDDPCLLSQAGAATCTSGQGFDTNGDCCTLGAAGCCPLDQGIDKNNKCCPLTGSTREMSCCSRGGIVSESCDRMGPICRICIGVN